MELQAENKPGEGTGVGLRCRHGRGWIWQAVRNVAGGTEMQQEIQLPVRSVQLPPFHPEKRLLCYEDNTAHEGLHTPRCWSTWPNPARH